ncbi:MAG TPA: PAS domain S-box protein [Polyangia bacterium]
MYPRAAQNEAPSDSLAGVADRVIAVADRLGQALFACDPAGERFSYLSAGATGLLGFPHERWCTEPGFFLGRLREEDGERVRGLFAAAAAGGAGEVEVRASAADGRTAWLRIEAHALPDPSGAREVGGSMADVTERRLAEEVTRERFDEVAEATFEAIVVHAEGRVLSVNRNFVALFGWGAGECVGRRPLDMITPESHAIVEAHINTRSEEAYEARCRRKDGSTFMAELRGRAIRYGARIARLTAIRNITARLEAEDALRRALAFSSAVVDTAGALVVVLDRDGRIVRFNQTCEDVTGYRFTEVAGEPVWQRLLVPEEIAPVRAVFEDLRGQQVPSRFENFWLTRDGRRRLIRWSNTALIAPDGRVEHVIATGIDVTEQRRAEEQNARLYREAQEAVHARDEFISIAAHELRSPVTAVLLGTQGLMRLAAQREVPAATLLDVVRTAERQTKRLSQLVEDLLDVSRIGTAEVPLSLETVDLGALARDVGDALRDAAERAGCALTVAAAEGVTGRWDRARLEQVVSNLLTNAIKYGAGRPVALTVEADGGRARLRVRDEGIGIPPEMHAHIFERFGRAVSAQHYGGLGLGLYIVRRILEALGGSIAVESAPGRGAAFTVELPRSGPIDAGAAAPERA